MTDSMDFYRCEICSKMLKPNETGRCTECWGNKMKVLLLAILGSFLVGCASLQDKAFDISEGDSEAKIVETLGKPRFYVQSMRTPGAMALYYQKSGFVCGFTVKEKVVLYRYCIVDIDRDATAREAMRVNSTNYINVYSNPLDKPKKDISSFDPDQYLREKLRSSGGEQ